MAVVKAFDDHDQLLSKGLADFQNQSGVSIAQRFSKFAEWVDESASHGLFQFNRNHHSAPDIRTSVSDLGGRSYEGLNFSSQDYLGLARHPKVIASAVAACERLGTHSAGSEPMGGGLASAKLLETKIAGLTRHRNVVLFPTGWAAGYGGIKGIIRPTDIVLLDALAHDCLQHGAQASSNNVSVFAHNDVDSLRKRLRRARFARSDAAILVITESLFSMDSDHPDFVSLVEVCKESGAHLMVDCAHDLGVLGPGGTGVLAEAGVLEEVDFLVGSFSKTFACIGGFFASNDKGSEYAVRAFSGTHTFSNYLVPAQVAAVTAALDVAFSKEGEDLRRRTLHNSKLLAQALTDQGIEVMGRRSAMVMCPMGSEKVSRLAYRRCLENGLIVNCIEFPACRRGESRFRFQVTPKHQADDIAQAAKIAGEAYRWVTQSFA